MKARLIRIGNSRGVRLPKPVIEEAGLEEHVELQVRRGAVVISSRRPPRAGWAEAARRMRELGEDRLLVKRLGSLSLPALEQALAVLRETFAR